MTQPQDQWDHSDRPALPKWRIPTWLLVGWTVLMAGWAFMSLRNAETASGGVIAGAMTILFVIWFAGFVVLSLVWMMTRMARKS